MSFHDNPNLGANPPREQTPDAVQPATAPMPDQATQEPGYNPDGSPRHDPGFGTQGPAEAVDTNPNDTTDDKPSPGVPEGTPATEGPRTDMLSTQPGNWGPRSTTAPTVDPHNLPEHFLRLPSQFAHPLDLAPDHGLGCPVCGNELFIVGAGDFQSGGPSEPRKLAAQFIAHSTCDGCGTRLEFVFEPVEIRVHAEPLTFAAVAEHAKLQTEIQAAEDAAKIEHYRSGRERKTALVNDLLGVKEPVEAQ